MAIIPDRTQKLKAREFKLAVYLSIQRKEEKTRHWGAHLQFQHRRRRQAEFCEFQASQNCIVRPCFKKKERQERKK